MADAHIVPCAPLDYLVYRGYANTLVIFPFPDPSLIEAATKRLRDAFEYVAQRNPYITGHVRLTKEKELEYVYFDGATFGDRFQVNILLDDPRFPYNYNDLKAAGMPPNVWSYELFAPYEKGTSLEKGPLPTVGLQLTFIPGAMVLVLQQHHSCTDGVGLMMTVARSLKKFLDDVPAESVVEGLSKKIDRWIDMAGALTSMAYNAWQHNGVMGAIFKTRALLTAASKTRTQSEQDALRRTLTQASLTQSTSLPPNFLPPDLKYNPTANRTPFPAPSNPPPYRTPIGPTTAIFLLPTSTITQLKSRIRQLVRSNPALYLSQHTFSADNFESKITSTTVLAALFWTHITQARAARPGDGFSGPSIGLEGTSTFGNFVNVRDRLDLPWDYAGNGLYLARAKLPIKQLIGEDGSTGIDNDASKSAPGPKPISTSTLAHACVAIASSIAALTPKSLRASLAYIASLPAEEKELLSPDGNLDLRNGPDLYFSSWSRFGAASGLDIPGAATKIPAYSRKVANTGNDGAVIVLPKVEDKDDWEVQVDLRGDDLERVRAGLGGYVGRVVDGGHWGVVG